MEARIHKLISSENLTPTKFADIIGVQRSAISHILSGRNKPSFDVIQKILNKFPRLNAEWLMMGRGEMYKTVVQKKLFEIELNTSLPKLDKKDEEITVNQTDTQNIQPAKEPENRINERSIERIIIFYTDKSFKEYSPTE